MFALTGRTNERGSRSTAVIDDGQVIAAGTSDAFEELVPGGRVTIVEADLTDDAVAAVQQHFGSARRRARGIEIDDPDVELDAIVDVLRPLGVDVRSTYRNQVTLDDVFVHLTGKELRE